MTVGLFVLAALHPISVVDPFFHSFADLLVPSYSYDVFIQLNKKYAVFIGIA